MSLLTDIRTLDGDVPTGEEAHVDLAHVLDEVAQRVVDHGTRSEAHVLHAMAGAARRAHPGAAAALVDWDGAEVARLRAFGVVHGVVLHLGPDAAADLLDRVRDRASIR